MSQTLAPARVSPPGRILSREIEARGWTQKDLAEIMGRPHQTINGIVKGNKQITPETAIELAEALGTSAEFWTNLEAKYRLHIVQKELRNAERNSEIFRRSRLYTFAPVAEMIKRCWLPPSDSIDELEEKVCHFFGISQVEEFPQLAINFRQSGNRDPKTQAQMTWAKRVENIVQGQKIPAFDRASLEAAIPDILTCAADAEDIALVPPKLLSLGIHFAIVPHLERTYLDGAAFYLEDAPVIALTLRHKRIDNFWFTLMHELGHIVAGHQGRYLDDMENLEVEEEEEEANRLATSWLLDSAEVERFVLKNQPYFSSTKVQNFAISQDRHPGILVGRLHQKKVISYRNHKKFLVKIDQYLTDYIYP